MYFSSRTNKSSAGLNTSFRTRTGASPGIPGYPTQRQPSRVRNSNIDFFFCFNISFVFLQELGRENSHRDRQNAMESLRKASNAGGASNPNITNSRENSRNVSPDSNKTPKTENNTNTSFDEVKTQTSVHSLIQEYTENYSDNNDRPVNVSEKLKSSVFYNEIFDVYRKLSKIYLVFARQILITKLLLFENYLPMS
jgi:hypothetical protein